MKQVANGKLQKLGLNTIPKSWDEVKLRCLLSSSYLGGNYPNSETSEGLPLIKMGNIGRGNIVLDKIEYLPRDLDIAIEHFLNNGDLLFNTRNTLDLVGKVSVWNSELPEAVCNSNLLKMFFKKDKVFSNYFMNYVFNSYYVIKQLRAIATGTTSVAAVYNRDLKNITILLPSIEEQKNIETILSAWDNVIENIEKLVEAKRRLKKGLMQKLITGKLRFKEFTKVKWAEHEYDELFKTISGKRNQTTKDKYRGSGKYPVVDQGQSRIVAYTDENKVFPYLPIIVFGDHTRIVKWVDFPFVVGADGTQLLKTKSICDMRYGFYVISNLRLPNLGYSRHFKLVKESIFLIPSNMDEQKKIAKCMSSIDREIELLLLKLDKTKNQKKGLMQKLLTGNVRVKI